MLIIAFRIFLAKKVFDSVLDTLLIPAKLNVKNNVFDNGTEWLGK